MDDFEHSDLVERSKRIRAEAIATRERAIRERLSLAFTYCSLAENEAMSARDAKDILSKVQHTIDEVRRHLDEPSHVSPEAMDELQRLLSQLEARVQQMTDR